MKKKLYFLFFSLFTVILLLNSCAPAFPSVASVYVSPFELTPKERNSAPELALSPDGETMAIGWMGGQDFADLRTGERIQLTEKFGLSNLEYVNRDIISGDRIFWSSDGRYLGMVAKHYENGSPTPTGWAFYRFDLQTKAAERYELSAYAFSPFDSNKVLTENGVYDLRDGTVIPFAPDFDFRQEQEFGVTSSIITMLWSKNLGVPVAELHTGSYLGQNDLMGLSLFSYNPVPPYDAKYIVPSGFSFPTYEWVSEYTLDPTGEYIVAARWECSKDSPCAHISRGELPTLYTENVRDTVITLIRWQSGEQQELIRLSEIDAEHVVADGYIAWSADGSTIFVARKDAPAVVLKVKYP